MGKQLFANNAVGVLASGITNVATTMTLAAGQGALIPTVAGGDWCLITLYQMSGTTEINHEVVKVTAHTAGNDVIGTMVRGQEGTTARAFNAADPIQMRATKGTFEQLLQRAADAFTGLVKFFMGSNIASAATVDLSNADGNTVHVTGTVPISAVTMTSGQWMDVIYDAACPLTYHATNHKLLGGVSFTAVAGAMARYHYDGTTVRMVSYTEPGMAPKGPAWSVYNGSGNQTVTSGVDTKVVLNTIEYDTHSVVNTGTYRITPNVAGYYRCGGRGYPGGPSVGMSRAILSIYKNGSIYKACEDHGDGNVNGLMASVDVPVNGTTDYIEFFITVIASTSAAYGGGISTTYFQGHFVRPL